MPYSNVLDPPQLTLPPYVWEHPHAPEPVLRPTHAHFITRHIYDVLEHGGYHEPHRWLKLCFTGSLCTYQYSDSSDADISLFIDSHHLPEWSRAEMIGLMIEGCDGVTLPGTTYELQAYVVGRKIHPADLYKPGLRAGYDINHHKWISPPDPTLIHDVKSQENGFYTWALQAADKMERLMRYEPDKAQQYYLQIHRKRMRDQTMGKGDNSESNILYKFLDKRGLLPKLMAEERRMTHAEFRSKHQRRHMRYSAVESPFITPDQLSSPTAIDRGLSRPVDPDEFEQLRQEGARRYAQFANETQPTWGLDVNWPGLIDQAYRETREPWGGLTIDSHTGQPLRGDADVYALTVKEPGHSTVSIPANANSEQFAAVMNHARDKFKSLLERSHHHLGIFHDADLGRIDFDPTIIVDNPHDVETIGAHTNAIGGAYHFKSGDGYWPPHVPHEHMQPTQPRPVHPGIIEV